MKLSDAEAAARREAGAHEGVVLWTELAGLGLPHSLARRRVQAGAWARPHREIYVIRDLVRDPVRTAARAAFIAGPDGALASHLLAGHLHRLHGLPDLVVPELTVAPAVGHHVSRGLVVHRAELLEPAPYLVQGFAATSAARTLADLSPRLTVEMLVSAMDSALRSGIVSLSQLDDLCSRWDGRPGVEKLRLARPLAAVGSDSVLETMVRLVILRGGLPLPELQIVVVINGVTYRIDLGYRSLKIAIEADGREWHEREQAVLADRRKQNDLVNAGWHPLRFTWEDVTCRPQYIVKMVGDALALRSSAPPIAGLSS